MAGHGQIELSIVTPEKQLLGGKAEEAKTLVEELRAPGAEGYFGVRPGHTPFLTRMEPGELWYRQGSTEVRFAVGGGFIEVGNDKVTVLAEEALPAEKIDVEAAKKQLADAQAKLKGLKTSDSAYPAEQGKARWAQARLWVAGVR